MKMCLELLTDSTFPKGFWENQSQTDQKGGDHFNLIFLLVQAKSKAKPSQSHPKVYVISQL